MQNYINKENLSDIGGNSLVKKILIATLYNPDPVILASTKLGPDKLILLIDDKPNKEQENALKLIQNSLGKVIEVKAIKTISQFARECACTLYFVHIGSTDALNQILIEKKNGTKIFVETCPHYLTLSYEKQDGYLAKVMRPIRTSTDVQSVPGKSNEPA